MKKSSLFILAFFILANSYSQKNKKEQAIVDEGKKLYRLEMASWYGTDMFLERFPEKQTRIGGYFSYEEKEIVKCLFFTN